MVLLLLWVLALLGDNPMQSEFACHAGLKARLFCRICMVKGHENNEGGVSSESGKLKESLTMMVARVKRFLQVSTGAFIYSSIDDSI